MKKIKRKLSKPIKALCTVSSKIVCVTTKWMNLEQKRILMIKYCIYVIITSFRRIPLEIWKWGAPQKLDSGLPPLPTELVDDKIQNWKCKIKQITAEIFRNLRNSGCHDQRDLNCNFQKSPIRFSQRIMLVTFPWQRISWRGLGIASEFFWTYGFPWYG